MAGIYNGPARGGNRGGKDMFAWENVKEDKYHQSYIGHSVMAPIGRWQKGKDLYWFLKKSKVDLQNSGDIEKKEVKAKENDLMLQLLGEKPMQPPPRGDLDRIQKNKLLKKGDAEEGTVAEAITKEEFGERVEGIGYAPIKIDDLRQAMETSTTTRLEGTGINDLLAAHAAGEGPESVENGDDDHAAMLAAIEGLHQQLSGHSPSHGPLSKIDKKEQKRMKKELKKLQKAERKAFKKKKSEKKDKSKSDKVDKRKKKDDNISEMNAKSSRSPPRRSDKGNLSRSTSFSSSDHDPPPPYRPPFRASSPDVRDARFNSHHETSAGADAESRWRGKLPAAFHRRRSPSPRSGGAWDRDAFRRRSRSPQGERRSMQPRRSRSRSHGDGRGPSWVDRDRHGGSGYGGRSRSRDRGERDAGCGGGGGRSASHGQADGGARDSSWARGGRRT